MGIMCESAWPTSLVDRAVYEGDLDTAAVLAARVEAVERFAVRDVLWAWF